MKITGTLWFDWKNGWYICKDLDPPAWVMDDEKGHKVQVYNSDNLADFLSTNNIKSGQAFEIDLTPLETKTGVYYYDGLFREGDR